MPFRLHNLRRHVVDGPHERVRSLLRVRVLDLREAKVRQLHVAVVVEQDVLGLEVAVHDVERVQVPDGADNLRDVKPRERGVEETLAVQPEEQVPAVDEVHDEVQLLRGLERVSQRDDEGVVDDGEDVSLRFHVVRLLALDDDLLLHHFHGVHGPGVLLAHLEHLAERTLSHEAEHLEIIRREPFPRRGGPVRVGARGVEQQPGVDSAKRAPGLVGCEAGREQRLGQRGRRRLGPGGRRRAGVRCPRRGISRRVAAARDLRPHVRCALRPAGLLRGRGSVEAARGAYHVGVARRRPRRLPRRRVELRRGRLRSRRVDVLARAQQRAPRLRPFRRSRLLQSGRLLPSLRRGVAVVEELVEVHVLAAVVGLLRLHHIVLGPDVLHLHPSVGTLSGPHLVSHLLLSAAALHPHCPDPRDYSPLAANVLSSGGCGGAHDGVGPLSLSLSLSLSRVHLLRRRSATKSRFGI